MVGVRVLAFLVAIATPFGVCAQGTGTDAAVAGYPDRPIRYVIAFSVGTSIDVLGRIVAQHLSSALGQPVVVDNRPGVAGNLAAEIVARAKPDGYTLLHTSGAVAASPALYPNLAFDPATDLAPVAPVSAMPFVMMVRPSLPVKGFEEFIEIARAKPGHITFGVAGVGSLDHLTGELLASMAKITLMVVPYSSSGALQTDLLADRIDLSFSGTASAMPFVKAGKVRGLAVTSLKRVAIAPELPTVAEMGLAGYETINSSAIYTAPNTPLAIIVKLNREIAAVLQRPDVRERFAALSVDTSLGSPEELGRALRQDIAKWKRVSAEAGIKIPN